jgi:CRISPR/Cas system-associated exonuclease Cas4 (RecB family)
MNFLDQTAQIIVEKHAQNLQKILVVLPSRRAKLFFDDAVSRQINAQNTDQTPTTIIIDDWVHTIGDSKVLDGIEAYFEFYEAYKNVCNAQKQPPEPFDKFVSWAGTLLADFDELDKQMVDTSKFFAALTDEKHIELWGMTPTTLTHNAQSFLQFWEQMRTLYQTYGAMLLKKRKIYSGMAYKQATIHLKNNLETYKNKHEKVFFVGFNALTTAEYTLINILINANVAEIFWNADEYYLTDKNQEAGRFLRNYMKQENWNNNPQTIVNQLVKKPKNITVCAVPQSVGEAKYAGELLKTIVQTPADLSDTAVILCNESLLFALLGSLPPNITKVNATVGYAVRHTPLFGLLQAWFKLQDNAQKFSKITNEDQAKFYFRDVQALLNHPYIAHIYNPEATEKVSKHLKKINKVLLSPYEIGYLGGNAGAALQDIFTLWKSPKQALTKITIVVATLCETTAIATDPLLLASCKAIQKAIRKIDDLNKTYNHFDDMGVFKMMFLDVLSAQKLPFEGTPLQGLQIMGLLEARTLGFKNLIVLSANEGTLPENTAKNTMMPYTLRQAFKLPNTHERDSMYAYNLYSLMQDAENVHFLYSTETNNALNGGEKSRFLLQIEHELCRRNPNIVYNEYTVSPVLNKNALLPRTIVVQKTDELLQKIDDLTQTKGISPTMLNSYVQCPLKFYLHYIIKAKAAEEPSETIDSRTLGDILHKTLETIYQPYLNQKLTLHTIATMKTNVPQALADAIGEHYKGGNTTQGKNYLVVEICAHYIHKLLDQEAKKENLTVLFLEEKIEFDKIFDINGKQKTIKITGNIDRIDELDGVMRIIDYKTGGFAPNEIKINSIDEITQNYEKSKAFQLLHYAYLCYNSPKINYPTFGISSGIYAFRKMKNDVAPLTIDKKEGVSTQDLEAFEQAIVKIITDIYDTNTPFAQTTDAKRCARCDFGGVCNR